MPVYQHRTSFATKFQRQARKDQFVVEMIANGGNATKAAIACGVKESSARTTGMVLCRDKEVQAAIEDTHQRHREAAAITSQSVLSEIARIAGSDLRELLGSDGQVDISTLSSRQSSAIAELVTTESADSDGNVTTKRRVKLHDKLRALEMLAKYLKLLTDRVEVEGLDKLADEMKKARERVENGK
jgi:phage terminase small subunit